MVRKITPIMGVALSKDLYIDMVFSSKLADKLGKVPLLVNLSNWEHGMTLLTSRWQYSTAEK